MNAVLDLPEIRDRHAFNLARWKEICANPELLKVEGRIESDACGHILLSPPPGFNHSTFQARILKRLQIAGGDTLPECPVSTTKGVRGVDAVWISHSRRDKALRENVLTIAPEICVEVISPGNTRAEMDEKRALLFKAGAEEAWFCDEKGRMFYLMKSAPSEAVGTSTLCPDFPASVG